MTVHWDWATKKPPETVFKVTTKKLVKLKDRL